MKTCIMITVAILLGIAAGYGSLLGEFVGVLEQFEPNSKPASKVTGDTVTEIQVVDPNNIPRALVLNGETYDFGVGQRESSLSHAFEIQNAGNAPLELTIGHKTCKCTEATLADHKLAPGKTTTATLTWKLSTVEQEFEQGAEIYTNDPLRPAVKLQVKGLVIDKVRVMPDPVVLGEISSREGGTARFFLFGYKVDDLAVTASEFVNKTTAESFDVKFENFDVAQLKDEPHVTCAMLATVTVKSGLPLGPIDQTIRVTTNAADVKPLDVKLNGSVVSDISLVGAGLISEDKHLLDLGTIESASGTETLIHILVKGPFRHDVKLTVAEIDPAADLTATLGEPKKLRDGAVYMYPLTITVPKNSRPTNRLGSTQGELGKITIHTTHPTAKTLPIYIRFAVK